MGTNSMPNDIAFTCLCNEPEGEVLRTVRLLEFTKENLDRLYQQISKFPTFMGVEVKSYEDMLRFFVTDNNGKFEAKGLCYVIDDFIGLFWVTDIIGIWEASVHYTFFDRRHKGRVDLCKKALTYTFEVFKFHRLHTAVPITSVRVLAFIESLGFVKVGRLRKNRLYKGKFYDTCIYDMLREEFNGQQSG